MNKKIEIIDNTEEGDCLLWYCVFIFDTKTRHFVSCVCHFRECSSFEEAIDFYYRHYHREHYIPQYVNFHKYSNADMQQLAQAC